MDGRLYALSALTYPAEVVVCLGTTRASLCHFLRLPSTQYRCDDTVGSRSPPSLQKILRPVRKIGTDAPAQLDCDPLLTSEEISILFLCVRISPVTIIGPSLPISRPARRPADWFQDSTYYAGLGTSHRRDEEEEKENRARNSCGWARARPETTNPSTRRPPAHGSRELGPRSRRSGATLSPPSLLAPWSRSEPQRLGWQQRPVAGIECEKTGSILGITTPWSW